MSIIFEFCASQQQILETAVEVVMTDPAIRQGEQTSFAKDCSDEQIVADVLAHAHYKQLAKTQGALYFSEESLVDRPTRDQLLAALSASRAEEQLVYVCDEIDGSSEFSRFGPMRSPLSTAIMAVQHGAVLAAVVGDIWSDEIYGLQAKDGKSPELCVRNIDRSQSRVLAVADAKRHLKLPEAMLAGYAPSQKNSRIDLLWPLFSKAAYVHNNGGHLFALRIAKSYSCALELIPKELTENIGPILASAGGAVVTRLDGSPLGLNVLEKQTSVTAASPALAKEVCEALHDTYLRLNVPHRRPIKR